ncbi:hypothetical protein PsYK624_094350 [Phanerochaete sordida]|uniref:Methyltransferase n=1 Tax=Phanerochaete sordida TaxID=48140 RepID=A0A9P3GE69_9APHY|nr:hypothetical protein PsYK624_094350 [Phanerochaete sordida]
MTVAVLAPADVPTTLNYYAPDPTSNEEPHIYIAGVPEGKKRDNLGTDPHDVVVRDARGKEKEYGIGLNSSGFEYAHHVSAEKEFEDEERIKDVYYKEVEDILKKATGAKRVFIFDHTVRRRTGYTHPQGKQVREASNNVHIDQTYDAGVARVYRHMGDDAERLLKGRVRIINVWRPIGNPVAHEPLALEDWRAVDKERDLVPLRFLSPDDRKLGEIYSVRYNPNHKWYYLSNQTPDEVALIKCYDSEESGARFTPHTGFVDKSSPAEAPHRESIEVRCLVFDLE